MTNPPHPKSGKPPFFYGYVVVMAAFVIQLVGFGIYNIFGVFFNPLLTEFGWTRATVAGAHSTAQLIIGFCAFFAGSLSDRYGPRIVITVSGIIFGLGYLLLSQVNAVWHLYLFYGITVGLGASGIDAVLLSTVARWFVRKRGMLTGVVKVGTGIGMMVMPLLASWVTSGYGWRNACLIVGIVVLVFMVSAAQFLRRDPYGMGQWPDGVRQMDVATGSLSESGLSLRVAAHTYQFWMVCAIFFAFFYITAILIHIVPYAVDLGTSTAQAAGLISVIGGASIVGRLAMGIAGDRVGSRLALVISFVILLVAYLCLLVAGELWVVYLFTILYGFSHGGIFVLMSPVVADLFGTSAQGMILGSVIFVGCLGGALGLALTGHIFDITGSYRIAFLVMTALGVICLALAVACRPIKAGEVTNDAGRGA